MSIHRRMTKKGPRYDVSHFTPEGKQKWRTFDKKQDALDFEAKVRTAKRENRYPDVFDVKKESKTTFDELAEKYLENHRGQRCFKNKARVVRMLRARFGDRKLSQIDYLALETYRNERKETLTFKGEPPTDGTVNYDLAVLGHMMNKAVQWGLLENYPFKKGASLMFRLNNQRIRFLSEPEIEALLAACLPHLRPIVETAMLTGMRKGEILGLKWEAVRNGLIHLTETKSGKPRQIPINDQLAEVLKGLRRENQLRSEYVFCNAQGGCYRDIDSSFKAACRRAGIEDFRFHDLRHTFASRLVMRGASIKAVQELLGHASLAMTLRYAHLAPEHLRDTVNLLNDRPVLDGNYMKSGVQS